MTTRKIPQGGSSPSATRSVLGTGTTLTPQKDHQGELARPTEEITASKLDILTGEQISKRYIPVESPFNSNFGGCQTAMEAAHKKALEEAQKLASNKENKG